MARIDDGGSAFPIAGLSGMRLRDYFAAQAIAAFLHLTPEIVNDPARAAEQAYALADAMLVERGK